jgi:hypothetical protein
MLFSADAPGGAIIEIDAHKVGHVAGGNAPYPESIFNKRISGPALVRVQAKLHTCLLTQIFHWRLGLMENLG